MASMTLLFFLYLALLARAKAQGAPQAAQKPDGQSRRDAGPGGKGGRGRVLYKTALVVLAGAVVLSQVGHTRVLLSDHYLVEGMAEQEQGRDEQAVASLEKAQSYSRHNLVLANTKTAQSLINLGRVGEAMDKLHDTEKYADFDFMNNYNLASLYFAKGQLGKSNSYYDRVLRVRRDAFPAYYGKAKVLGRLGKGQEAVEYFKRGLRYDVKGREYVETIEYFLQLGRAATARVLIREALRAFPDDRRLQALARRSGG